MLEPVMPILRAAGVALFTVGTILFLLNPPSLSGAEGLVSFLLGGAALALVTAWVTVVLRGREEASEPEFERAVVRAERLAEHSAAPADRERSEFEQLVAEAIDELPEEFRRLAAQTPVVVSQRGREERAYGHYFGDTVAGGRYEHRIVLYEDTLERDFGHDRELLAAQVERTLRHEIAHHLGWQERGVQGLGL